MEQKGKKREVRDVTEVELRVDDFKVDAEGNVRIASRQIADRVKAAIATQTRVRGRMIIPIEP